MQPFSFGHGTGVDWNECVDNALARGPDPGDGANLGFIYITDALAPDLDAIVGALRERTRVEHWVGTVGLGICASGVEYYDRPAVAVMTACFEPDSYRVFQAIDAGLDRFEMDHGGWCAEHRPYFGVVHADPRNSSITDLVVKLSRRMDTGFLVGGLASARQRFAHVADAVEEGGLSGVLFDSQLQVSTRLTQGCSPLGPRHQVSRAEGNLVFELDGEPALDVLKRDVGEVIAGNLARAGGYIFVGLPIAGLDTGDYLVRNLVGIDPNEGIIAVGDRLHTGDALMFCRRDATSAVEDMERMLDEIEGSVRAPVRGAVYATCIGRGINLFGDHSEELKMIERRLGPIPLVGFYANGEICHDRLYGYTGVLTLFC